MTSRFSLVLVSTIGSLGTASLALAQPAEAPPDAAAAERPAAAEVTPPPAAPPPAAEPLPAPPPGAPPDPPPVLEVPPNPPPAGATPPTVFKIDAPNGSSLKLGVLLQPQFSAVGDVTRDSTSLNLFVRRTRILVGGNLFGVVEYFVDTDYPNLFLASTGDASVKATPGMNVQDAFLTYKAVGDAFKIDAGYMLPPMSHNAVQGAGTLYSWDYFTYSFQHSNVFGSSANPIGRDAGIQLRGLVLDNLLEYRLGMFQGLRDGQTATEVGANNMFRITGRVQINLLEPETGFFYAGSYLGSKSILSIGGSFDIQDEYKYFAGDVTADLPVGGNVATAQVNVAHWDGGDFVALPEQTAIMAEAGFHFSAIHLAPIVRFEKLMVDPDVPADQTRLALGLAYFPSGHNVNIKAFYSNLTVDGADHSANQFNLQGQLYVF